VENNELFKIKGIGEGLQKKIVELVSTGGLQYYEELKASIPPGLIEMLQIPGLGPKKVKALNEKLGIETIEQLEQACKDGKVAQIDGFGEKTQAKILEGISFRRQYSSKHLLFDALLLSEPILESLRNHPDVIRAAPPVFQQVLKKRRRN
jgi:DNA polymerase (family 10)